MFRSRPPILFSPALFALALFVFDAQTALACGQPPQRPQLLVECEKPTPTTVHIRVRGYTTFAPGGTNCACGLQSTLSNAALTITTALVVQPGTTNPVPGFPIFIDDPIVSAGLGAEVGGSWRGFLSDGVVTASPGVAADLLFWGSTPPETQCTAIIASMGGVATDTSTGGGVIGGVSGGHIRLIKNFADVTIPTLSEWGLFAMALLGLTLGTIAIGRRTPVVAGAGAATALAPLGNPPLFVGPVFTKTLAATLGVVVLGCAGAISVYGELAARDIAGSLLCAVVFAYMAHLWIVYTRDRQP